MPRPDTTHGPATLGVRAHRADIQGLRALAVLLVIGDHLLSKPRGGFVGVDVFFVISGFLITGLLLKEHERTGRISLAKFYKRRVKRIGPAAALVITAVIATSMLLLSPSRLSSVAVDAVWAALSAGNWRMIAIGTDYMHATDAVSPLQHYWSLAVEEQFYLLWPLVLLGALTLARRSRQTRRLAAITVVLILALSLAFGAVQSRSEPTAAYFSSLSRAWELAAGALLALAAPRLGALPRWLRRVLAWGGLALILASSLLLSSDSVFPVPDAALPIVGTCAVIAAGMSGGSPIRWLLGNRPAVWVGERSYSLYLWHFPLIVFMSTLLPQRGGRYTVFALAVTLLLAEATFHLVEEPFRRRSWRQWRSSPPRRGASRRPLALGLVALLIAGCVSGAAFGGRTPLVIKPVAVTDLTSHVVPGAAESAREHAVKDALLARRWPDLTPTPRQLGGDTRAPEWIRDGCLGDEHGSLPDPVKNAERCTYGQANAPHTAVLLGDSVAISWMPGLRKALGNGWRIEVWTEQQCPAVDVDAKRGDGTVAPDCDRLRAAARNRVAQIHPDLTILTSSPASLGRLDDGATGTAAADEWQANTKSTLSSLAPFSRKVVLLDAPPDMHSAQDCIAPASGPVDCISGVTAPYLSVSRAQRAAVKALHLPNVSYPDNLPWFCAEGRCPSFVGANPTLADGRHLTASASAALAPLLRSAFFAPAVAPAGG